MKLSNRAKSALATAGYPVNESSAIAQLTAFAAQNSGIDPRNYFSNWSDKNGIKAFKDEQRSISEDWRRFKKALLAAAADGVTDENVISEAPHAYSGRLEWKQDEGTEGGLQCEKCGATHYGKQAYICCGIPLTKVFRQGRWEYCTGQYFPTEYRAAAATLLEYAARKVRQERPPEKRKASTIAELKALNEQNGGCWFEKGSMRFFGTRIESGIIKDRYFITSEQQDDDKPRKFTIRSFDEQAAIDTVGKFHAHDTKADAIEALNEHLTTATINA